MSSQSDGARVLRHLDGIEKAFWFLDQVHPTHFCLAAELAGQTTEEDWLSALSSVGRQSTLIASQIVVDPSGNPFFSQGPPRAIPLKLVKGSIEDWNDYVGDELATEFDVAVQPLVRAVLLHRPEHCILVLTLHHSIADGLSASFLLRDIMHATAGEEVRRLDETDSLERAVQQSGIQPVAQASEGASATVPPPRFRSPVHVVPTITSARLSVRATAALRKSAKQQAATVHGALCAAATIAFSAALGDGGINPPRVFTPIDARTRLFPGAEQLGVYLGGVAMQIDVSESSFWEGARQFSRRAASLNDVAALTAAVLGVRSVIGRATSVENAAAIWAQAFGAEICVSNLANIGIPTSYGHLALKGLWGPAVSLGIDNEQTIGAVTVNGQLHLLHTTFIPARGFLKKLISVLETSALN